MADQKVLAANSLRFSLIYLIDLIDLIDFIDFAVF